jgi:hypothetical protein
MKPLLLLVLFVLIFMSCGKEDKSCWQAFDPGGFIVPGLVICDKTYEEAQEAYPQYWFYQKDEPLYCWKVNSPSGGVSYTKNVPISMTLIMMTTGSYTFTKQDCNSFCTYEIHEKIKSKQTGLYGLTKLRTEVFLQDSCSKLFEGKVVVYNETADSITTREFFKKIN